MTRLTRVEKDFLGKLHEAGSDRSGYITCCQQDWRMAQLLLRKGLLDDITTSDEAGKFGVRLASLDEDTPGSAIHATNVRPQAKSLRESTVGSHPRSPHPVNSRLGHSGEKSDRDALMAALHSAYPVVLLHGRAGTGKTTLIRCLQEEGLRHVVVAPTGIAALNAGGQTIHRFFGIPPRIVNLEDIEPRDKLASLLRRVDIIVIDEISMVRADLLDVIDQTLRVNLKVEKPFGGKKLLLVGDFLQLPPVVAEADARILQQRGYRHTHAFGAKCLSDWQLVKVVELRTVYRQSDPEFLELLHHVRCGSTLEETVQQLNLHCYRKHRSPVLPVTLTARKDDACAHNSRGLAQLEGDPVRFWGTIEGDFRIAEDRLPAPEELDLKVGARILMVKNDLENGLWVNGSLGTVSELSENEVWVSLDSAPETDVEVTRATWESFEYRYDPLTQRVDPVVVGTYKQFPIAPAWAMTIHKAQGLTLDDVRIDLGSGAFSSGQTYVALSRARSLDGLSFSRPLRVSDVRADTRLVDELRRFVEAGN